MLWHGTGTIPASYGQPVFDGALAGDYGAAPPGECEKYKRLRKETLRKMWKTPVFTKKRRAYEMQANEYAARYKACMLRAKRSGASKFKVSLPKELTKPKASFARSRPDAAEPDAPLPVPAPPSGPPTALFVGGAVVLGLLALFAFSGKKGGTGVAASGKGSSSFTVSRSPGSLRRVAR